MKQSYRVAVLCSGIGGSVIGYEMADYTVQYAVDKDEKGLTVLGQNYQHIQLINKKIRELSKKELTLNENQPIDLLDIAIPASYVKRQPQYSTDKQSSFLVDFTRILFEVEPLTVVCHFDGNFATGKHRLIVNEWLELIKEVGYEVELEVLKSSLYGVANDKKWAFIVGVRKDLGIKPVFPDCTDGVVTTKQAIQDLVREKEDVMVNPVRLGYAKTHFPPGTSLKDVKRIAEQNDLPIHSVYYQRDRWNQPFFPLPQTNIRPFHPVAHRLLTLKELKRLQSFPDDYLLEIQSKMAWKEICSSVPPLLVSQVAWAIKKEILDHL